MMIKQGSLSNLTRILLFAGAGFLLISLFMPIWRIELQAPQYPEGLMLQIYASKLGGNVDIINGLNHYIGMQTLHEDNFIEFTILPYIISFYAILIIVTALINKKKMLYISFSSFVLFGVVAMVDFWRWEYNYGHNLDPEAAIIVPGMAYQPPLIGFKQLLNFGAYSIPDIGGWLFIACGVFLLTAVLVEVKSGKRKSANIAMASLLLCFQTSCKEIKPEPVILGKDQCDFCKMSISDGRYSSELITAKGRINKFDDVKCLKQFVVENRGIVFKSFYVSDFNNSNNLINAESAFFVTSERLSSPMGGNTAAFADQASAITFSKDNNEVILKWNDLNKE